MSKQIVGQTGCLSLGSPPVGLLASGARNRGWLRLALFVLCAWLWPVGAQAQDYAAAGQHFDAAQEAFQQGDFKRAAKEYQAAYAITKDPALLFSIGESFQRAAEPQRALEAYRAYLREQPSASDRPEVEKRIRALEESLAPAPNPGGVAATPGSPGQAGTPPSPGQTGTPSPGAAPTGAPTADAGAANQTGGTPAGSTNPPEAKTEAKPEAKTETKTDTASPPVVLPPGEKPTAVRTAAWVGTAAAVALGTAGAIVGLGAQNRADELRRRTTLLVGNVPPLYDANQADAYTTLMSEGQSYNTASIALLTAAGVAGVVSAVLFIVDFRQLAKRSQAAAKPSLALFPSRLPERTSGSASPLPRPLPLLAGSF